MNREESQNPGTDETDQPITAFRDEFGFLSNFYAQPVTIEGDVYPTAEHAFQAMKTLNAAERRRVRDAPTPAGARRLGKRISLRDGWSDLRFQVMKEIVRAKFSDPLLAAQLIATGSRPLIEGNTWRDTTWGCAKGKDGEWQGRNELGKILMQLRQDIQKE